MLNFKLKVIKTIWVNIITVSIVVYIYVIIYGIFNSSEPILKALLIGLYVGLIIIYGYGLLFWIYYLIITIIFSLLFINKNVRNLKLKLITESILVASPFIYGILEYNKWVFLIALVGFLISQFLFRKKKIENLLKSN